MAEMTSSKQLAALLVTDPYNDFIPEGGKIGPRIKGCCRSEQAGFRTCCKS
jgi:hypothetical protein